MLKSSLAIAILVVLSAFACNNFCIAQPVATSQSWTIDKYVAEYGKVRGNPSDLGLNGMKTAVIDPHFYHPQNDLFIFNAPAFRPLKIGQGEAPALSPDGGMIAYCGFLPGKFKTQIWIMKADGSVPRQLTDMAGSPCDPAWSPTGMKIAFSADTDKSESVFVLDFKLRTVVPIGIGRLPRWSPDGKQLVFLRAPETSHAFASIWVSDADGKHERLVIETAASFPAANWSNDGQSIIYMEESKSGKGVYRVDLDGKNRVKLTGDDHKNLTFLSVSPDGRQLFLVEWHGEIDNQNGPHENNSLLVVDLNTQKPRWLTNAVTGDVHWTKGN